MQGITLILSVSYGNDSIALIQHVHERGMGDRGPVLCAFSETGWAAKEWAARVERGESLARSYGFEPHRIPSIGFVPLARLKKAWPRNGMQFCTEELKRNPFRLWAAVIDPNVEAVVAVGIRREESDRRRLWPEWSYESEAHGGRDLWSPLVDAREPERDSLLRRAGFEPLPHRSRECYPCINSGKADLWDMPEERIAEIEGYEAEMGKTGKGKPRTLFRPAAHGGGVGIRATVAWANSDHGAYDAAQGMLFGGCDSGFCGS